MATNPNENDTSREKTSPAVQINVSGPITVNFGGINPPLTPDTKRLVRSVAAKLGEAALTAIGGEELTKLFGADGAKSRGYMSGADADKAIQEARDSRVEVDVPDADPEVVDGGETEIRLQREPAGFDGPVTAEWLRNVARGSDGFSPDMGSRLHAALDRPGVKRVLAQHGLHMVLGDNGGYRVEDVDVAARLGDELVSAREAFGFGTKLNDLLQIAAARLGELAPVEDKLMEALDKSNFKGSIDQARLIKEAAKLGFPESVGIKAWELLDYNPEIVALCEALQVPYPEVGMNGKFRVDDVRSLVRLEGFTNLPGLQARSRIYKVLSAL